LRKRLAKGFWQVNGSQHRKFQMQTKRRMIWKEKNVSPREAGVRILGWV
jgi:hypothetical protein